MSHTPHYFTATNVLIEKDGKVLLSRRQNKGWGDGLTCIPGGHVEAGETPADAAVRELEEELGLKIKPEELEFLCVEARHNTDRTYLSIIFTLKTDQEPVNNEPHECSELVWQDPKKLGKDIIENFKLILEKAYLGGEKYLEYRVK